MDNSRIILSQIQRDGKVMRRSKRILKLNADYNLLDLISFKRALSLFVSGKINIVKEDETRPVVHPSLDIRPPLIVVLREYRNVPFKRIRLNRRNVLARDEYICQYCGCNLGKGHPATIDHIVPKNKTSSGKKENHWLNLVACCSKCNNRKGDRTPNEAGMKLLRKPFVPKIEDLIIADRELKKCYKELLG